MSADIPLAYIQYIRGFALILFTVSAAAGGWETVHPQSLSADGAGVAPSIRYGHTCSAYKGQLLVTHGYYYDRARALPTWLSDTWAMDGTNGSSDGWHQWSPSLPQSEAFSAYSNGRIPAAPCGRFGHVSAIIGDALYLYGGNDGGYSRTNRDDYKPGNDFDELWHFDLTSRSWSFIRPASSAGPGKRHMAGAAAVQGKFIVYGGMGPDRGDVWSYSPEENRWELLSKMVPVDRGGPGQRCGHAMMGWVTPLAVGFVVYGGQSQLPGGPYVVRNDAWFFDLEARSWRQLRPSGDGDSGGGSGGPAAPLGHFYQAVMAADLTLPPTAVVAAARAAACRANSGSEACSPADSDDAKPSAAAVQIRVGVVAGGSTTTPALSCSADAWVFTLDCTATRIAWGRLPDLPMALYDTRGAAVRGAAYIFGGHLCSQARPPPQAPYPYAYVNEALRLDLGLGLDDPDLDLGLGGPGGVAALLRGGVGDGAAVCAIRVLGARGPKSGRGWERAG